MREVGFDAAFMFKYSERPGTYASKYLPDDVPEEVKIDRLNRMIALQNELSVESNRRDVGHTFEVLVEGIPAGREPICLAAHSKTRWWCSRRCLMCISAIQSPPRLPIARRQL